MDAAVEDLVLQHQDYVRALARGIAKKLPKHVDFEELVSLGQVGLVTAAKQYEAGRGAAFTTFAYYRVRGAILDGLRQMAWLPPSLRKELSYASGENEVGEQAAGAAEGSNDPEFLAKQFTTAVGRLGAVFLASRGGEGERENDPTDGVSAADVAEQKEMVEKLKTAIAKMPKEHVDLIRMLYFEHKSMTEVGQALGKNKSTISRRHTEAIDSLKAALAA